MSLLIHRGLDTSQVACIQLGSLVRILFNVWKRKNFIMRVLLSGFWQHLNKEAQLWIIAILNYLLQHNL